jgi:hypothetical protein
MPEKNKARCRFSQAICNRLLEVVLKALIEKTSAGIYYGLYEFCLTLRKRAL